MIFEEAGNISRKIYETSAATKQGCYPDRNKSTLIQVEAKGLY